MWTSAEVHDHSFVDLCSCLYRGGEVGFRLSRIGVDLAARRIGGVAGESQTAGERKQLDGFQREMTSTHLIPVCHIRRNADFVFQLARPMYSGER
jgi:hypothetical protein